MHGYENLAAESEVQAECLERREKLRKNKLIGQEIDRFWHEIAKDGDYMVSKNAYLDLFQRIAVTLVKKLTHDQALEMAQRDWLYDSQGRELLNYERFTSSLFELVDLFSPTFDPTQYVLFLSQLRNFDSSLQMVSLSKAEVRELSLKQCLAVKHAEMYPDSWKTSSSGQVKGLASKDTDEDRSEGPTVPVKYEPQRVNKLLNRHKRDTWDQNTSFIKDARKHGIGVCVIGPPLSGKTTLAQHLASLYGLQYVSESSVLASLEDPSPILDDLRAGKSVSKELVPPLLVKKLAELTSAGLGFVLDDINPAEFGEFDFIIKLQLSDVNIIKRMNGIKVDPTTGIRYSLRDRSWQSIDAAQFGFAERVPQVELKVEKPPLETETTEEEETEEKEDEDDEEEENEIVDQFPQISKLNFPLQLIPLKTTDLKQKIREAKCMNLNQCTSSCLIEIEASQSPQMVFEQAAVKLAGNSSIFPMIPPNVKALHIPIDESIENFADQLKWLLYADITDRVPENDRYLVPEKEPRRLSAWRTLCPVQMIQGDPTHAVIFSGHVFLLSSEEARVNFCAQPEKYLEKAPIDTTPKNIVLVSPLSCPTDSIAQEIAKQFNIRLISAVAILEQQTEDSTMVQTLRDGGAVAVSDVVELVCDQVAKESSGFLLTDIPSDSGVITKLKEKNIDVSHAIVMDAISSQDNVSIPDSESFKQGLPIFKEEVAANEVSLIEVSVPMSESDAVAQVKRGLNPFEPRVDEGMEDAEPMNEAEGKMINSLGDYGSYCGVTWIDKQRVVPGNESFAAYVNQRKYLFAGEEELEKFKRNVTRYLPTAPIPGPPPVILLLGIPSAGKLTQAKRISKASVLEQESIMHDVDVKRKIQGEDSSISSIYAEVLEQHLINTKADQCVILPGLGTSDTQEIITGLATRRVLPQYVLPLSITKEEFVKRKMSKWVYVPPQEDEEAPAEEVARADRETELENEYEAECEMLESSLQALKELRINVFPPIDAVGTPLRVSKRVSHALSSTLRQRKSIFCSPEAISVARARVLLKSGQARMGQHGIYCPIVYKEQRACVESNINWPVLYRGRIYFPSSPERQIRFLASVEEYIEPNASAPEKLPVQVTLLGPSKAGKTVLAQSLSTKLGIVHITPENAVEWVKCCAGGSKLSFAEAIELRIRSSECQRLGWVLDGFPNTIQDLDLAHKAGIRPDLTLYLEAQQDTLLKRCMGTEKIESSESSQEVVVRLIKTYGNGCVKRINANGSRWASRDAAESAIRDTYKEIQQHHQAVSSEKPGRIHAIRIDFATVEKYKSPTVDLVCPVEFSRGNCFLSQLNDREFTVEFNGFFYWLASQENCEQFIADPSAYSQNSVDAAMVPVDIAMGSSLFVGKSMAFAFQGYCPVTFQHENGKLCKGLPYLLAKYRGDVYTFTSDSKRQLFLHSPENYMDQTLPEHLPLVLPPPDLSKGPSELDRMLGSITKTALGYISEERIKYPGVGYRATSLYHLALWLKANNINALPHVKERFEQRLTEFEKDCRLADTISSSTSVGTAVKGIRAARDASQKDIVMATERFDTIVKTSSDRVLLDFSN